MPNAMFMKYSTVIEVQTWNENQLKKQGLVGPLEFKGKLEMEGQTKIDKYHITNKRLQQI